MASPYSQENPADATIATVALPLVLTMRICDPKSKVL